MKKNKKKNDRGPLRVFNYLPWFEGFRFFLYPRKVLFTILSLASLWLAFLYLRHHLDQQGFFKLDKVVLHETNHSKHDSQQVLNSQVRTFIQEKLLNLESEFEHLKGQSLLNLDLKK